MYQFNFRKIWNESLPMTQREPKERNYLYASELYKPMIDRYLALKGTPPSNVPNEKSFRKFWSGNAWNFIAGLVLHQLGIVQAAEHVVNIEDLPVPVHGRLDYLVGGIPDYDKARKTISSYPFEKEMMERFMTVINNFEQTVGHQEIELMVHEIKSCSEFVINMINEGGHITGHDLQVYHYLKGLNMQRGVISYISKNDSLMGDVIINHPDANLENLYMGDLLLLRGYLDDNTRPEPLSLITFEGKFKKRLDIEYSNYLTLVYGFKEPMEYSDSVKGQVSRWNRVLARLKDIQDGKRGKPTKKEPEGKLVALTDNNKSAIDEMSKDGYNAYELAKEAVIIEEEIEETE